LEIVEDDVDVSRSWETITENIKVADKESYLTTNSETKSLRNVDGGINKLKQHKKWSVKGCLELLDNRI
jgi:hypothetical protein